MRACLLVLLVPLVACTMAAPEPDADLRARQATACTATIMAHINQRPQGKVSTTWLATNGRVATVEVRDGPRRHLCQVDNTGQVLGYEHPGA